MMEAFPKLESEAPMPLTPTMFPQQLIPKPPGEVSHVGHGGYTLKDLLEEQHRWKNGLYDTIRVFATHSHASIILRPFQERVHSIADNYLDTTITYSSQEKKKIDLICAMV